MSETKTIADFFDLPDDEFNELLEAMSDDQMIELNNRINSALCANEGALAWELGMSHADLIRTIKANAKFAESVGEERRALRLEAEAKIKLDASAERYLQALDEMERRTGTRDGRNGGGH